MKGNLKICIISEYAFPYLKDGAGTGGAELQMTLLAKGLKRQYDVSFIAFDESIGKHKFQGIDVFVPYDNKKKGYAHLNPVNIYKLFKVLNYIDADIYIQRTGAPLNGIISFFSKIKNKIFIFSVATDDNVSLALEIKNPKDLIKLPYIYGVKNSNQVVCQTFYQKSLLEKNTSKKGEVIRNISIPFENNQNFETGKSVLWVGRLIKDKNPELYLKLACELPDHHFKMIASPSKGNEDYYEKIKNEAIDIINLEFLGFVPHNEIGKNFFKASLFVNTSAAEGFPNRLLEAWSSGAPVCSLNFDPDHVISNHKLGYAAENFEDLVKKTKLILGDEKLRNYFSENGIKYVKEYHNQDKIIGQYEYLFKKLTENI